MSVSQAIFDAAEYHSQLISQLERLGDVPEQLEEQNKLIKSLNVSLGKSEDNVKKLHEETGKQLKEHQEIQNSATKKLAFTLTDPKSKYLARAGQEEREYVAAFQQEVRERKRIEEIEQVLSEALGKQAALINQLEIYQNVTAELDELHSNIFDGTTSELPRDDELEQQLAFARASVDRIQMQLNSGALSSVLLADIIERLDGAIREASVVVTSDNGPARQASGERAQNLVKEAQMICTELPVLQSDPSSSLVLEIQESTSHRMTSSFIASVSYDRQLKTAKNKAIEQVDYTEKLIKVLEMDLKEAKDVLEEACTALRTSRISIFQRISIAGPTAFDPPPYSAT